MIARIAWLTGLLTGLALLVYGLWLWPAFRFLQKYRSSVAQGTPHNRSEVLIDDTKVHVYTPASGFKTVLIIVPGLHPNGIFDARFVAFANLCAAAGFQIVAFDIEEFRNFRLTKTTFDKTLSLMEALPQVIDLHGKRLGILGISYGTGPAFLIATKHKVDFLVSIGGYYNLEHAIEFSFTGIHGEAKREPHEWGRLIFVVNHLSDIVASKDADLMMEVLELRLQLKEEAAALKEVNLNNAEKELLLGILKGLTPEQTDRFREIARKREEEARALSPERFLNQINPNTVLYLLHGVSDDSIPFEESLELRDAAKKAGFRTHCLVTSGLTHVDVTSPAHVVEFLKMLHWIRLLLRER
jgi:hypothetical protein